MSSRRAAIIGVVLLGGLAAARDATAKAPFDVRQRRPWASEKLRGSPDPPDPYTTEKAFPRLTFFEPLSVGRSIVATWEPNEGIVLDTIREELDQAMALAGCARVEDVTRELLGQRN